MRLGVGCDADGRFAVAIWDYRTAASLSRPRIGLGICVRSLLSSPCPCCSAPCSSWPPRRCAARTRPRISCVPMGVAQGDIVPIGPRRAVAARACSCRPAFMTASSFSSWSACMEKASRLSLRAGIPGLLQSPARRPRSRPRRPPSCPMPARKAIRPSPICRRRPRRLSRAALDLDFLPTLYLMRFAGLAALTAPHRLGRRAGAATRLGAGCDRDAAGSALRTLGHQCRRQRTRRRDGGDGLVAARDRGASASPCRAANRSG